MHLRTSTLKHTLVLSCLLLVGLLVSGILTPPTEAAVGGCRSDPLVLLSDGTILDVSVAIGTAVSNVTDIRYVIHGPQGVKLVSAIRTPTLGFTGKETFTYYDDASAHQYVTEALVQTTYDHVNVTAYSTFAQVALGYSTPLSLQYQPVTGFNDQLLRVVLKR
jgi:hypothetical protein